MSVNAPTSAVERPGTRMLRATRPAVTRGRGPIVPTRHWSLLDDGRVQCEMCPRLCKLKEGVRGACFVRARENDGIVLTTYGRSSGFCIDPIEKKPLNHFLPGTPVLSFGTAGCNLACKFCQNHDISKSREMDRLQAEAQPEAIARLGQTIRLPLRRIHLQRSRDLPRSTPPTSPMPAVRSV